MGRIIKVVFLIAFLCVLVYVGACVYANFINPVTTDNAPPVSKATYYVVIENTGNILFTASYDQYGNVYVLHGYWEKVGTGFKYRDRDLILDQAVFGKITVRTRSRE